MKTIALYLLKFYQKILSPVLPGSCRYYPTCSEYARWLYINTNFFYATFLVILRLLRCNQIFKGGVDFPVIWKKINYKKNIFITNYNKEINVEFWIIPYNNTKKFYIIKSIGQKESKC